VQPIGSGVDHLKGEKIHDVSILQVNRVNNRITPGGPCGGRASLRDAGASARRPDRAGAAGDANGTQG
jgi:hypothetical protein